MEAVNSSLTVRRSVGRIARNGPADPLDFFDRLGHDGRVLAAQCPVDLDVFVVALGREADQRVGTDQAAETRRIGPARRHVVGLVDDEAGEKALFLQEPLEAIKHLIVGETPVALPDHSLGGEEQALIDNRLEGSVCAHPFFLRVVLVRSLQLVRVSVVDVVADVFLVDKHLVDGAAGPGPVEVRHDALFVQQRGDLAFQPAPVHELPVHPADVLHLLIRSRDEDHPVGLQALVLPAIEDALGLAVLVDAHAAQPVSRHAALAESEPYEPALARKHLV